MTRRPARPPTPDPTSTAWMVSAACVGTDPESWFPVEVGVNVSPVAKRICAACPVVTQCLDYAMTTDVEGWWAGTTVHQRRDARKKMGMPLRKMNMDLATGRTGCGTEAGRQRHIRSGETPCPRCQDAGKLRSSMKWDKERRAS